MHDGHRARMRERLAKCGPDAFHEHEILEMLLYSSIPRGNTNPIAHELIETFGSFSGVFDASFEELMKVRGVGESSAALIKLVPCITALYMDDKMSGAEREITSSEAAYKILLPKYIDKTDELPSALFLNNAGRLLAWSPVGSGVVNTAEIQTRKLVELCIKYNATQIIMCHNHPSGSTTPSRGDVITTQNTIEALRSISVRVLDHIIIAGGNWLSMADSKEFNIIFD